MGNSEMDDWNVNVRVEEVKKKKKKMGVWEDTAYKLYWTELIKS